jgi:hypothetical protein
MTKITFYIRIREYDCIVKCLTVYVFSLQTQLYEDFAKSRAKQGVEDSVTLLESSDNKERKNAGATHVFQVRRKKGEKLLLL